MIPNPIRKVLSSMREHQVQCLLMGGQACVLYGAAEFSRDTDLAVLANQSDPSPEQLTFWFQALRTPELLRDLARAHPALAKEAAAARNLVHHAISEDVAALIVSLEDEERRERLEDKAYWQPLKLELECLRRR